MSLDNDMAILASTSFFDGLDSDQLRILAFGSETVHVTAGSEVYLINSVSDCGYVVAEGLIDLTISANGHEVLLGSIESGGLIGEIALISDTARATNAIARRDSRLIRIPRTLFRRMLEKYPESAYDLHQKISRKMRAMVADLNRVQFGETNVD